MSRIPSLETCLQKFSRVEVDVYPCGGSLNILQKQRVVMRMCHYMEVLFFNPLFPMDYLIQIDKNKMESFIVFLYNTRSQVTSSKFWCFIYLKIILTYTTSSYPDEMQHFAALHLGLRCLSKYSLRSQMVKHPCKAINCSPRREG